MQTSRMLKIVIALVTVLAVVDAAIVRVDTIYGPVDGQTVTLEDGTLVNSFYGIPFAKPPIGNLRWRKPEPPEAWTEPRPANVLNAACPQGEQGLIWLSHPLWKNFNEDCLYLNIFTPADMTRQHPVMIWFHGGAYSVSANIQYPGHFYAQRDVVLVVPNYRLGALGFMASGDDAAPGNWGLHDQILAMRFVQDNIAQFGGDKDQVTIFGQSAGASSASLHMVIPESWDLFDQVIAQSGSELAFWAINLPGQYPGNYTRQVAAKHDCIRDDNEEMMECMRDVDWDAMRRSQGVTCAEGYYCLGFSPVVDGDLLTDTPINLRQQGRFKNCSMMAGLLSEDGSLYTIALIPEALDGGFNRTEFVDTMRDLMGIFAPLSTPEEAENVYRAMLWYYAPHPYLDDIELNRQAFNELVTDFGFGYHSELSARFHVEAGNNVYYYRLGYLADEAYRVLPRWMGVPHSADIPYMFGWPLMKKENHAAFDAGMFFDMLDYTELDIQYATYIADMWTNFAKYGNPTPEPVTSPGNNEPTVWPLYNTSTYHYLHMFEEVEVKTAYRSRNHAFLYDFIDYLSGIGSLRDEPVAQGTSRRRINTDEISQRISDFYTSLVAGSQERHTQKVLKKRNQYTKL